VPTKRLFSLEVEPYDPNRQLSIINSKGGVPRLHVPTKGHRGWLVVMISFEDLLELQRAYAWIKSVHRGYYEVRTKFEA
jgi:hypothetical protein